MSVCVCVCVCVCVWVFLFIKRKEFCGNFKQLRQKKDRCKYINVFLLMFDITVLYRIFSKHCYNFTLNLLLCINIILQGVSILPPDISVPSKELISLSVTTVSTVKCLHKRRFHCIRCFVWEQHLRLCTFFFSLMQRSSRQ